MTVDLYPLALSFRGVQLTDGIRLPVIRADFSGRNGPRGQERAGIGLLTSFREGFRYSLVYHSVTSYGIFRCDAVGWDPTRRGAGFK